MHPGKKRAAAKSKGGAERGNAPPPPVPSPLRDENDENVEEFSIACTHRSRATHMSADIIEKKELKSRRVQLESKIVALEGSSQGLQQDLTQATLDASKCADRRSKLEELCRTLQLQSKTIQQEIERAAKEYANVQTKSVKDFENAITDIKQKLAIQIRQCEEQENGNVVLEGKLESFVEQCNLRFTQEELEEKQRTLEHQLMAAKKAQAIDHLNQETERLENMKNRCELQTETLKTLRGQVEMYRTKMKACRETVESNEELWPDLNKKMEELKNNVAALEAQNRTLRQQSSKLDLDIIAALEERGTRQKTLLTTKKSALKLEVLCRSLHLERVRARATAAALKFGAISLAENSSAQPIKSSPSKNTENVVIDVADDTDCDQP